MLSMGVTGGAGKTGVPRARSAGYNRKTLKLSTIVAGRVRSGPVPARSSRPSGDSTIADSPDA